MRPLAWTLSLYDSGRENLHMDTGKTVEGMVRRLPSTSTGESWNRSFPTVSEETSQLSPWSCTPAIRTNRKQVSVFEASSLWYRITTALANEYTQQVTITHTECQCPQLQNGNTWPAYFTDLQWGSRARPWDARQEDRQSHRTKEESRVIVRGVRASLSKPAPTSREVGSCPHPQWMRNRICMGEQNWKVKILRNKYINKQKHYMKVPVNFICWAKTLEDNGISLTHLTYLHARIPRKSMKGMWLIFRNKLKSNPCLWHINNIYQHCPKELSGVMRMF